MLITIDDVFTPDEVATARDLLGRSVWASGRITAGTQAAQVKNNQQLPEEATHLPTLRHMVLTALGRNALFFTAALPLKILPPFFNRYVGKANYYGFHTDNAMRLLPEGGGYVRADVSATLFLSEPEEYDGGELIIEDTFGCHGIKLKAGSLVVYPSSSIHQVAPVTRGVRLACFMFIQSMVRDPGQRRLLFDMDMALLRLREQVGEINPVVRLTGVYHNLLRRWADS
ncbi:PKHD-type hydroxylase [Sulfuritortus calidifontis]|uniref:PKHD-type hydroxylase n=1 Tax=Sulfuritortus calidifontis TaxID=1914471 RepID=A0A4V2UQJ1_9PROT|nr:Fe2+-dependent dioxygenase [Sulfuritortus calidifontis]TCS70889.1 PKHD-type hydroxylase [Sulfuritortus calidifontis]